jgi:anti-sigma28 factor (negative regulator of flagellin synthesis)
MRKTWNSWTYYGDRESGRGRKGGVRQESVCQESVSERSRRQDERSRRQDEATARHPQTGRSSGGLEDAYGQALEQSLADALERAMDLCDLRQERVARVKRAIEAGVYWVPAEELARKLVRNMLGDYR